MNDPESSPYFFIPLFVIGIGTVVAVLIGWL